MAKMSLQVKECRMQVMWIDRTIVHDTHTSIMFYLSCLVTVENGEISLRGETLSCL
jgi:hypothetical protein